MNTYILCVYVFTTMLSNNVHIIYVYITAIDFPTRKTKKKEKEKVKKPFIFYFFLHTRSIL